MPTRQVRGPRFRRLSWAPAVLVGAADLVPQPRIVGPHRADRLMCNPRRRHTALGMLSPHDFETLHTAANTAA